VKADIGSSLGFLKLIKDNLNVPSEYCMSHKLLKGSMEEKVYQDPSNLVLFCNRHNLVQQTHHSLQLNNTPSLTKHPSVPLLQIKQRPEDVLREIRAMSRHINNPS
jgi:hypothetical protein